MTYNKPKMTKFIATRVSPKESAQFDTIAFTYDETEKLYRVYYQNDTTTYTGGHIDKHTLSAIQESNEQFPFICSFSVVKRCKFNGERSFIFNSTVSDTLLTESSVYNSTIVGGQDLVLSGTIVFNSHITTVNGTIVDSTINDTKINTRCINISDSTINKYNMRKKQELQIVNEIYDLNNE